MPENPDESEIDLAAATEREIREGQPGSPRQGLNITGLRTVSGLGATASRFSGLFSGSDEDSSDSDGGQGYDEDDAGRDVTVGREEGDFEDADAAEGMSPAGHAAARRRAEKDAKTRRPSTTEAKERMALDDEDEITATVFGGDDQGPFADPVDMRGSSSEDEDELVEIRPRRTS